MKEVRLTGTPAAPGAAVGPIHLVEPAHVAVEAREVPPDAVEAEIGRFRDAVAAARGELATLRERVAREIGDSEAGIFDAHQMVLEDPLLHLEVSKRIRDERRNAAHALQEVMEALAETFANLDDEVMRERAADIVDVGRRVLRHLAPSPPPSAREIPRPSVVIARDLSPSETATMDPEKVLAIAIEVGGPTSHTAILARGLGIPAVVGVAGLMEAARAAAREGRTPAAGVDGGGGLVVLEPSARTVRELEGAREAYETFLLGLRDLAPLEAETIDGVVVDVAANIEVPAEIAAAREQGARGIGLYRTEYLFLDRAVLPDEEEQYRHYRVAAEAFPDDTVDVRTIDIGGDKFLSTVQAPKEMNPFMGLRAIRLSLAEPEAFRTQIRAILRASLHGKVRILFPMISVPEELEAAIDHVADVAADLRRAGHAIADPFPVGIMVETPAAALSADLLAERCAFFSLGTNDLVQYALAADRAHERLAYLYQPLQAAILRLVERTVEAGRARGVAVSVCGEMAADPLAIPVLLGLGIRRLSMSPAAIPLAKKMIRSISLAEAEEALAEVRLCRTEAEVRKRLEDRFWDRLVALKPVR